MSHASFCNKVIIIEYFLFYLGISKKKIQCTIKFISEKYLFVIYY